MCSHWKLVFCLLGHLKEQLPHVIMQSLTISVVLVENMLKHQLNTSVMLNSQVIQLFPLKLDNVSVFTLL